MFSAIFSSPRCRKPMSGVALVMISPSSSSTSRRTPCVAGCDGPMLSTIFSPISSCGCRSSASAVATRVTGSGDSISRTVKGMGKLEFKNHYTLEDLRWRVNQRTQAQNVGDRRARRTEFTIESPEARNDDQAHMKKVALLFAGQGAQAVGMGCDLAEAFP